MIMDILEFDQAVAFAFDFYRKHPKETLIIVTADHETGGLSLGAGKNMVDWEYLEEQWEKDGKKNDLNKEENEAMNRKASIGWTTTSHTGAPVLYSL